MTDRLNRADRSTRFTRQTISARYLLEMIARGRPSKASLAHALEAAVIAPRLLRSSRMRLSIEQYEAMYRILSRETGDELFGFFAHPVPVGAYATMLRMIVGSVDLGSAMDATYAFYRLFDRHPYWRMTTEGRVARLLVSPRDRGQASSIFFAHLMLLSPVRTIAWLGGIGVPVESIRLPARFRSFQSETRYLFGCEPSFGRGPLALTFPSEALRAPVVRTANDAIEWSKHSLRHLMLAPAVTSIQAELRVLLAASSPVAGLSIDDAARALHMSRATLARRLSSGGASFQQVKDELRRDRAIGLLTASAMSIPDISERLGYSAPSAFHRAFREWTGVAPGAFRSSTRASIRARRRG